MNVAIVYNSVHAHVQKRTCTCTETYMHMYTSVHKTRRAERYDPRGAVCRQYSLIFVRCNFVINWNEAENV